MIIRRKEENREENCQPWKIKEKLEHPFRWTGRERKRKKKTTSPY